MALDELHGFGQALLELGEIDWIVFEIGLEENMRNRLYTEDSNTPTSYTMFYLHVMKRILCIHLIWKASE